MNEKQLLTLAQLRSFLGTVAIELAVVPDERYAFIARTAQRFDYAVEAGGQDARKSAASGRRLRRLHHQLAHELGNRRELRRAVAQDRHE